MREGYEAHKINHQEYVTVIGSLNKIVKYEFRRYEEIRKGMITEVLEIPELEEIKECSKVAKKQQEKQKKAKEEVEGKIKKITLELLSDMYQNGIELSYIESLATKK